MDEPLRSFQSEMMVEHAKEGNGYGYGAEGEEGKGVK